jgi:hypothetical protein
MRRVLLLLTAILASFGAAGCFNPFSPVILSERVTTVAPSPTTPIKAVKLFEWCWVNRGVEEYKELFTEDYVFVSAAKDSAGNPSREIQARREDEIQTAENMFIGSAERPPAAKISLSFDRNFVPLPDTREGYRDHDSLFKTIRTTVALMVDIGDGTTLEVTGYALFYLVRGDTAAIPKELKDRGFKKDKSRWWISRWEDETIAPEGGLVANADRRARPAGGAPTVRMTISELKRYYGPAYASAFARATAAGLGSAQAPVVGVLGARAAP